MIALFHASARSSDRQISFHEEKQIVFILIYTIYHIYLHSNFYFRNTAAFPIKAYRFIFVVY